MESPPPKAQSLECPISEGNPTLFNVVKEVKVSRLCQKKTRNDVLLCLHKHKNKEEDMLGAGP